MHLPRGAGAVASLALALVLVLALGGLDLGVSPARADSWRPYEATRFTDASGRFVVAVEPTETGNHLTPGRTGPRGRYRFAQIVDGAEVIRGEGALDELPLDVRIAPRGRGFAALRAWAGDGRGRCIVLADERGVVRRALTLAEVWTPQEVDGMSRSSHSVHWMRGAWWTPDGAALVLVPFPGGNLAEPRIIPLDPRAPLRPLCEGDLLEALSGRGAAAVDLVEGLSAREGSEIDLALDLVAERRLASAAERVAAIAADPAASPSRRVRAVAASAALGRAEAAVRLLEVARGPAEGDDAKAVRELALSRVEWSLGPKALDVLLALHVAAAQDGAWDREVLLRVSWLERADPQQVSRHLAASQGRDGPLTLALAGMAASLRDGDASRAVLVAAGNASDEALDAAVTPFWMARRTNASAILAGALREHPRATAALVEWFEEHLHPPVVAALVDELERRLRRPDEKVLASLTHALEVQTGAKHGTHVADWRRWQAGTPK